MAFSGKASFFVIILVLSVSSSNLSFAQSYNNSSNNTASNLSSVFCGYDLWGDLYLVEHGTGDLCNSKGTPTLLSKSKGMLSPDGIQQLVGRDRQLYAFMWIKSTTVSYSDLEISKMCQYDKNGNFVGSLSDIQKEVLIDLKNNFGIYICPFTGTPTPLLSPPETHTGAAKLLGVTPAMPKCQSGEVIMADVCLSRETTCPPGFGMWDANICVFLKPSCPSDSVSGNGVCTLFTPKCHMEFCDWGVLPLSCPQGTYMNGICVLTSEVQPTPMLTCPEGYGFKDDLCVKSSTLPRQTCPFGTAPQNGMCVASEIQQSMPTSTEENSTKNNNSSTDLSVNDTLDIHSKTELPSPLKQEESGIPVKNIQCKQDLVLLLKMKNGYPLCVKPQTAQKLVERGWAALVGTNSYNMAVQRIGIFETNSYYSSKTYNEVPNQTLSRLPTIQKAITIADRMYEPWAGTIFKNGTCGECTMRPYLYSTGINADEGKLALELLNFHQINSAQSYAKETFIEYNMKKYSIIIDTIPIQNGTLSGKVSVYGGVACNPSRDNCNPSIHYEIDVYASDGITVVGKTFSGDSATYTVQLTPGNYIIYTYGFHKLANHVSIVSGHNTIFNITYDSGIR
ncbi:MAG: hypothetical protein AUH25_04865 [Thaumarchaeota archaeon 13_1_40CM_38_12]|nr:MAG: hypothetical protein AUH25_04865 [Thaumarchaeota archaeon 13_1_40CM_38_12]OLC33508.1 MAG: hypothetical protein AUH84_06905 [Thaumarchaeota archaeon 13_1_40CM_4_38_7]